MLSSLTFLKVKLAYLFNANISNLNSIQSKETLNPIPPSDKQDKSVVDVTNPITKWLVNKWFGWKWGLETICVGRINRGYETRQIGRGRGERETQSGLLSGVALVANITRYGSWYLIQSWSRHCTNKIQMKDQGKNSR